MKRKRWFAALCALVLLLTAAALAEEQALSVTVPEEVIRPGRAVVISFTVPEAGEISLRLLDEAGLEIAVISRDKYAYAGVNHIYWNGTWNGYPAPEGTWRLVLEKGAETAETPVTVGPMAPSLISVSADRDTVIAGSVVILRFYATESGRAELSEGAGEQRKTLLTQDVKEGNGEILYEADLAEGRHELTLTLTDGEGTVSDPAVIPLMVFTQEDLAAAEAEDPEAEEPEQAPETAQPQQAETARQEQVIFTPAYSSPYEGQDTALSYWTLPMDITDEEAVWNVLMQPVTVLDNGRKNTEKTQVVIRSEPDENSSGVGVVTCITQGVHVLEKGKDWTLIECYSSSFHDSAVLNWNALVQGYVPTAYLRQTEPSREYGLVIDKLTQRLYIFQNGHLLSTLLVSTGLANRRQPYNETRSGEFLMTSAVGTFASDNMKCAMAIRFNKGDLLHEVPYILMGDGVTRNYKITEPKLGTKASHGCIRVQRKPTPEGINQGWLWSNRQYNTKLLIWEDWQGRQVPLPSPDTKLYYRPKKGRFYHSKDHCESVELKEGETMESFTYGQLNEKPFSSLKPCEYCAPLPRLEEIEALNAVYAFGGDHDPVMTKARESCPKPYRGK